jgi:hypothetical protein
MLSSQPAKSQPREDSVLLQGIERLYERKAADLERNLECSDPCNGRDRTSECDPKASAPSRSSEGLISEEDEEDCRYQLTERRATSA